MEKQIALLKRHLERTKKIPNLEIRKMPAGMSYDPSDKEKCDDNGYVMIENIYNKPRLKPEWVSPRCGVGHNDPKTNELIKFVEFPEWDQYDEVGRRTPENGYKFSKIEDTRLPLGIVIIEHSFGNKMRKSNDLRRIETKFNPVEKIHKKEYIFMYLEEEGHYIQINTDRKKRENAQRDPVYALRELYKTRKREAEEMEELATEIFNEFRKQYAEDFFPRDETKKDTPDYYDFHEDVELIVNGTVSVQALTERLEEKWLPFISLTESYIDGLLLSGEITKEENKHLYDYTKKTHESIQASIEFLKSLHTELKFHVDEHDFKDNEKQTRGPIKKTIKMMRTLLTPRKERIVDPYDSNEMLLIKYKKQFDKQTKKFYGYLAVEGDTFFPTIGEFIRSIEVYDQHGDDKSEERIKKEMLYVLRDMKEEEERNKMFQKKGLL
jgi:hypothetical protein